jgi:hypothetical protein
MHQSRLDEHQRRPTRKTEKTKKLGGWLLDIDARR